MPEAKRHRDAKEIKENKWNVKRQLSTFRVLFYWFKFMGINPLSLSDENELKFSYLAMIHGCILGLFYCYIGFRAMTERKVILLPSETPISFIVDVMRIIWQCFNGSSMWFVFAIYQNRVKLIVESFANAERTSRKLGIQDDYEKRFKEFGTQVTIYNIVCLISLLSSETMWTRILEYDRSTWRMFNFATIASFNMIILFVWSLSLVKRKLHRLNEKLRHLTRQENLEVRQTDEERCLITLNSRCNPEFQLSTINMVSQLHRDLRITIHRIHRHFTVTILFSIASSFNYTALTVYRLYRYVNDHTLLGGTACEYLIAVSHEILFSFSMLIMISYIYGSTADKANDTSNMLHVMINNWRTIGNNRVTAEVNLFSLELLQNRISMSACGLFKLDSFLVYSTLASVTNYLTIMLQLQT